MLRLIAQAGHSGSHAGRYLAFVVLGLLATLWMQTAKAAPELADPIARAHHEVIFGKNEERNRAIDYLKALGNLDAVPTFILGMRVRQNARPHYLGALRTLTRHPITDWFEGALWLEEHPEVRAHPYYRQMKLKIFRQIDPDFDRFLALHLTEPEKMKIRLEEIYWGGVLIDGIPSLDNPNFMDTREADYLLDEDLVFGVEINGDARAYPLRIMGWHEMMNDVIGGVPVALAYCTLCGAGILYETQHSSRSEPFIFSTSGLLYRSNKLMYDRQTASLWNQFTGQPVSGALVDSAIALKVRPLTITTWRE